MDLTIYGTAWWSFYITVDGVDQPGLFAKIQRHQLSDLFQVSFDGLCFF